MRGINLSNGGVTYVDDCDFDYLTSCFTTWRSQPVSHLLYAVNSKRVDTGKWITVRMHRLIMESIAGFIHKPYVVDHIDGNSLNNVRNNLRICTQTQNMQNQTKVCDSSSIYKGVGKRENGSWVARIRINRKLKHIGYFAKESDAAIAYNKAALQYFGEFAKLNKI